jgi:hypothetical protein
MYSLILQFTCFIPTFQRVFWLCYHLPYENYDTCTQNQFKETFSLFPDVIHTVGPVGQKPALLEKTYRSCLDIVKKEKLLTVVSVALHSPKILNDPIVHG